MIADAAWHLFAVSGPDGVSLREVAQHAGCTHALVARYFGSKGGIVAAVADQLAARVAATVAGVWETEADPPAALLAAARRDRSCVQLVVRCGLGDLHPAGFPSCLGVDRVLAAIRARAPSGRRVNERRVRICTYGASSLLLGWLTFEGFLVAATRLGRVSARRRDLAIAAATDRVMDLAAARAPSLIARNLDKRSRTAPPGPEPSGDARQALLDAAVVLFAQRGPASVSVRDIARHAGVNQGLIYRHFGSKPALVAEAIEQGSSSEYPAALAAGGFDLDTVVHQIHHGSPAPRLIARTLVDGIAIATVRTQFPVLRELLAAYDHVPTGSGPADLSDPRIAVAAAAALALGSAIWGRHLRGTLELSDTGGLEAAVADIIRVLLAGPNPARPVVVPA